MPILSEVPIGSAPSVAGRVVFDQLVIPADTEATTRAPRRSRLRDRCGKSSLCLLGALSIGGRLGGRAQPGRNPQPRSFGVWTGNGRPRLGF